MYSSYLFRSITPQAVLTGRELVKVSRNTNLNNIRFYTQGSREDSHKEQKTGESGFNESAENREWINTKLMAATAGISALALGNGIYQTHQKNTELSRAVTTPEEEKWYKSKGAIGVFGFFAGVAVYAAFGDTAAEYFKKCKNKK